MKKHFARRLYLSFSVLLGASFVLTFSSKASGQCETYREGIFDVVSSEYREKVRKRFDEFLRSKCREDMDHLYGMLTSSFRQLNKKEDFVKDMKSYYSGDDKFVSFIPMTVGESLSPIDSKPSIWLIEGCVTEIINGKKRSIKILLEVVREDEELFFTDITTRPNPLGNDQKCKP